MPTAAVAGGRRWCCQSRETCLGKVAPASPDRPMDVERVPPSRHPALPAGLRPLPPVTVSLCSIPVPLHHRPCPRPPLQWLDPRRPPSPETKTLSPFRNPVDITNPSPGSSSNIVIPSRSLLLHPPPNFALSDIWRARVADVFAPPRATYAAPGGNQTHQATPSPRRRNPQRPRSSGPHTFHRGADVACASRRYLRLLPRCAIELWAKSGPGPRHLAARSSSHPAPAATPILGRPNPRPKE